jgi:hypothetical protein
MLFFLFLYTSYALNNSDISTFAPTATLAPTVSFVPLATPSSLPYTFFSNTQSPSVLSSNYVISYSPTISTRIAPAESINQNYNIYYTVFTLFGCGILLIGTIFFCVKQNQVEHKNRNLLYNIHTLNNPVVNNPVVNNPVLNNPVVNNPVVNNPVVNNPVVNNPVVNNPVVNNQHDYNSPKSVICAGKIFYYDGDTGKLLAEGWQRYSDNIDVWYNNSITNESSWVPVYLVNRY